MPTLVVEHTFEEPVSVDWLTSSAKLVDRCLAAYGAHWMRSYLSTDRKRMFCEFEAADAEQVRQSYRAAGVPFDACWIADVYSRDQPSESY